MACTRQRDQEKGRSARTGHNSTSFVLVTKYFVIIIGECHCMNPSAKLNFGSFSFSEHSNDQQHEKEVMINVGGNLFSSGDIHKLRNTMWGGSICYPPATFSCTVPI